MGYVYIAEAGKYCKIGISDRSVEQRMCNIQTGCPVKISRVWCSRNIPDHRECEKILHNHFREAKTHGEWFEISFFEAAEKADSVCRSGADKVRIEALEKENRILKDKLSKSYTKEEIMRGLLRLLPEKGGCVGDGV